MEWIPIHPHNNKIIIPIQNKKIEGINFKEEQDGQQIRVPTYTETGSLAFKPAGSKSLQSSKPAYPNKHTHFCRPDSLDTKISS